MILETRSAHGVYLFLLSALSFNGGALECSFSHALQPLVFRAIPVNRESEFCACATIDVNGDNRLDIVSGGWWYEAPTWKKHRLRDVERIGTRFDDYSNLTMDVDADGDLDLISVNYRSKSIYWVRNTGSSQGDWPRVLIDTPGPSETGRLVDIDRDGQLDILPNGTTYAAWYSLKPGSKSDNVQWVKHDLPQELVGHGIGSGDINGDGRVDIVAPNGWAEAPADPVKDRWVWHADFKLARDCSVPILTLDVDGDGDMDLIWGRGHNVGLYWTEQRQSRSVIGRHSNSNVTPNGTLPKVDSATTAELSGASAWVTHAIDTSWSCLHAPLLGDLDGDGSVELIAGKRFQGHEGRDPGENDPLGVFSYQFDKQTRSWHQRTISLDPICGLDLDPKCVDIDGDGDLDIIGPARSGLVLLENLRLPGGPTLRAQEMADHLGRLPESVSHNDFTNLIQLTDGQLVSRPIANGLDMGHRRRQIQRQMELVMGRLPSSDRRVPLNIEIQSTESCEKYSLIKLTYFATPENRVPAYLAIPHELSAPAPAMLCLHPTHQELGKAQLLGIGGKPSRFYAHELAERGMVCLVPDYPGFGEYAFDFEAPGNEFASGTMKAIWDNIRGLDLLESLPCVRRDSIGCIGHSLGGHNALYTAAFDVRIRAVVASCGFNAFEDYQGGDLKGWSSARYMPRIHTIYGGDPKRMPFDFPEVLAAIAPRPLFVNAPLRDSNFAVVGVRKCHAAVEPVYQLLGKSESVTFVYPDAGHDFPDTVREQAYDWLKKNL